MLFIVGAFIAPLWIERAVLFPPERSSPILFSLHMTT